MFILSAALQPRSGRKKILRERRIKVSGKESLRWHYPVQVMRVERSLLSA